MQALQDSDDDSAARAAAVQFEVELAFEGVEDRLDGLAERLKNRPPGRWGSRFRARRASGWAALRTPPIEEPRDDVQEVAL